MSISHQQLVARQRMERSFLSTKILIVKWATVLGLSGWTWQHLYWSGPIDVLFWQEHTFKIAELLGIDWQNFVGKTAKTGFVKSILTLFGSLLLACTILTSLIKKSSWWANTVLLLSFFLLLTISISLFIDSQYQAPMIIEHGGQMLMPVLFLFALKWGTEHRFTIWIAISAFIMTFAGHGLYAIGAWPTPGSFYAMSILILDLDYRGAVFFLKFVGIVDFIICFAIFFPKLRVYAALYGVFWGFTTALARPIAGMSLKLNYFGADQFMHEFFLRVPHFGIPLFLVLTWYSHSKHIKKQEGE